MAQPALGDVLDEQPAAFVGEGAPLVDRLGETEIMDHVYDTRRGPGEAIDDRGVGRSARLEVHEPDRDPGAHVGLHLRTVVIRREECLVARPQAERSEPAVEGCPGLGMKQSGAGQGERQLGNRSPKPGIGREWGAHPQGDVSHRFKSRFAIGLA